jgi:UDP:flavonoid glycosyltransferase YjiC (YdhE family)
MKILLISVGTRGDMEPFLAIANILNEKGHHVVCAFPEQFRYLAEDAGVTFVSLGTKFIELLESDVGKSAIGGSASGVRKFLAYMKLASKQTDTNKELAIKQHELIEREQPDRIVYNGKATFPIIWGIHNPGKTVMVSPVPYVHYVKDHTHVAFNSNFGAFLNKLTFALADFGMLMTLAIMLKWVKYGKNITRKQIRQAVRSKKVMYTISPTLFSRQDDWDENIHVIGYHKRETAGIWKPDKNLKRFLAKHKKIVFITFGSMTNPEPEEKTRIILDVLAQYHIPAIINTAAGGLIEPEKYDTDLVHFVSGIPYDWIFPKMYAVVHHGGSGTTHLALKYGCASMIVPHIIDQFVWSRLISDLGVGPRGLPIHKLTRQRLRPKLLDLFQNPTYKAEAQQISKRMGKEDLRKRLYKTILGSGLAI